MTLAIFQYDFFVQKSMEMDRKEYKLPEYSQKKIDQVKKRLNIRKDITKESPIKPTTLGKQEEIIANLFKLFNKITEKNYDKLSDEIFVLISQNISVKEKVCATFFQVVLNNSFFCHLYAKLFKKFIEITDEFTNVLQNQISSYVKEIKNIVYISPNENYDKYCDYVKNVDSIQNFTRFLIQCSNHGILKANVILELAITFQKCCLDDIDNNDNLLLNEIYVANIALIIKETNERIYKNKKWELFVTNHKVLMETQGSGKNKKMHFKLLDVSEQIQV